MNNAIVIIIVTGIAFILFAFTYSPSPDYESSAYGNSISSAAISVRQQPRQSKASEKTPFFFDEYIISPLADFEISARVLSRKTYWMGRESDLSPVDFALGWGRMSELGVLETISISQSNRWYYWQTPQYPIPRHEIESNSANMHMIPANDDIKDKLADVDEGDNVMIKGQLVRVDAKDGWHWVSSLSRHDAGDKACELVYVTDIVQL
ncbi:MAG: hypothetical protein HKP55_04185 [Gammaproteobacteria bacterium]|nr:hypothetical protein [Gammaproteobacteria bacterium]